MSGFSRKHYQESRSFTDRQHENLASRFYNYAGVQLVDIADQEEKERLDRDLCIDYIGVNGYGQHVLLQERFRTLSTAKNFNDFTIRLSRPFNPNEDHKTSEIFKMPETIEQTDDPFWLMYSVIDDSLSEEQQKSSHGLAKIVVVDLRKLFSLIQQQRIIPGPVGSKTSEGFLNGQSVLYTGTMQNYDKSSLFIGIDVNTLYQMFPECVLYSHGFHIENPKAFPIQIEALSRSIIQTGTQGFFQNARLSDLSARDANILGIFFKQEANKTAEQVRQDLGQDQKCLDILHMQNAGSAYQAMIQGLKQKHETATPQPVTVTMQFPPKYWNEPER